ncbi:MAG: alpha/beta fold hydrolase [Planctomycetaceae bacterium]
MNSKLTATLCSALVLAATGVSFAQQGGASPASKGVEDQKLRTPDGWTIPITYYRSANGKETPVVIMLHGKGGNRQVWKGTAEKLHGAGYAVVTVDLRKHGESEPPPNAGARAERLTANDYQKMVAFDLETVKDFLFKEHEAERLNIRKTGIVAADDMAPVAAQWTLADWLKKPYPDAPTMNARTPKGQDVRALALLSPSENAGSLVLGRALPQLRNDLFGVAVWMAVGAEDRQDRGTAEKAYERLTSGAGTAKDRVFLDEFEQVKARGTELLTVGNANIDGRILVFFDKFLKTLDGPADKWRTRKSRLQ